MQRAAQAHEVGQAPPRDGVQGGRHVVAPTADRRQHDVNVARRRQRVQHLLLPSRLLRCCLCLMSVGGAVRNTASRHALEQQKVGAGSVSRLCASPAHIAEDLLHGMRQLDHRFAPAGSLDPGVARTCACAAWL